MPKPEVYGGKAYQSRTPPISKKLTTGLNQGRPWIEL